MRRTRTFAAALMIAALPIGLSACSGSSSSGSSSSSHSPSGTSGTSDSSGGSSDSSSTGDASGKPSRDAAKTGLAKIYTNAGMPQSNADDMAGCILDKGYDKFSSTTLQAFVDSKISQVYANDVTDFAKYSGECMTGGISMPSMPDISMPSMPSVG